jgi:RNA polymerase sigma-70 factor (ECF subfamily)
MDDKKLAELFTAIRAGSTEAFSVFYEAYKKPVFTVFWRIVSSREMAEDLTQDLFVKLFMNPPAPSVNNLRAYVFKMARNLALNALRSKQYTEIEDAQNHPAGDLSGIDLRLDLDAAISALQDCERQVLALHLNADLSFLEISKIIDQSLPSTYRTYKRALKKLRNTLDGGSI